MHIYFNYTNERETEDADQTNYTAARGFPALFKIISSTERIITVTDRICVVILNPVIN